MQIRLAKKNDPDQLVDLIGILTEREASFDFDREAHLRGLDLLIDAQPATCVAVAEEEGKIVGMVTGQTVISTAAGGLSVWVEDLVVHPAFRKQGLGEGLLAFLEKWGKERDARRFQLLLDRDNDGARAFYESREWEETNFIALRKKP